MTTIEKIRAEIQKPMRKVRILDTETQKAQMIALAWCLEIIDKYAEQEPTDENLHREREQAYMQGYEDASKKYRQEPCDDTISRQAVDTLVDELARAISDERCCMSRGRSTETIMQDILDLPSVRPQEPTNSKDIIWYDKRNYSEIVVEPQERSGKE